MSFLRFVKSFDHRLVFEDSVFQLSTFKQIPSVWLTSLLSFIVHGEWKLLIEENRVRVVVNARAYRFPDETIEQSGGSYTERSTTAASAAVVR